MKKKLFTYLQIAGFCIKITFNKTKYLTIQKKTKKLIDYYFNIFTVAKKPRKIDYYIQFIDPIFFKTIKKNSHVFNLLYYKNKKLVKTFYYNSIIQFYLIINDLVKELLSTTGFIIHGAAVEFNEKVIIFLGKSGSGKSTIIKFLKNIASPIADDVIIIKKENNGNFYLYPTFIEKRKKFLQIINRRYIIKNIYFLKKSSSIKIKKINNIKILFQKLMKQALIKKNSRQLKLLLEFCLKYNNCFNYLFFPKNKIKIVTFFKKILEESI